MATDCAQAFQSYKKDFEARSSHAKLVPHVSALMTNLVDAVASEYALATEVSADSTRLDISLNKILIGEIATRSRMGCSLQLGSCAAPASAPSLVLRIEEDQSMFGQGIRLHIENRGLQMHPVEGSQELYERLKPVWQAEGATDRSSRRKVAWRYWKEHCMDEGIAYTKMWKHIKSLQDLFGASMWIPDEKMDALLAGALCTSYQHIAYFEFTLWKGEPQVCVNRQFLSGERVSRQL